MNSKKIVPYVAILLIGTVAGYMLHMSSGVSPMKAADSTGTISMPAHASEPYELSASDPMPTIAMQALPDSKAGWNLHIVTTNFTFDPVNVGADPEVGSGHAHVFVDGNKVGRAYSDWYYLSALTPGKHTITVELVTNDHRDYQINGVNVGASVSVIQPGSGVAAANAKTFDIVVEGKKVVSGTADISVVQGDTVTITVTNDTDEEVHLHGYGLMTELKAGVPGTLTFQATASGRFPVELEGSKTDIGAVSVLPR